MLVLFAWDPATADAGELFFEVFGFLTEGNHVAVFTSPGTKDLFNDQLGIAFDGNIGEMVGQTHFQPGEQTGVFGDVVGGFRRVVVVTDVNWCGVIVLVNNGGAAAFARVALAGTIETKEGHLREGEVI